MHFRRRSEKERLCQSATRSPAAALPSTSGSAARGLGWCARPAPSASGDAAPHRRWKPASIHPSVEDGGPAPDVVDRRSDVRHGSSLAAIACASLPSGVWRRGFVRRSAHSLPVGDATDPVLRRAVPSIYGGLTQSWNAFRGTLSCISAFTSRSDRPAHSCACSRPLRPVGPRAIRSTSPRSGTFPTATTKTTT